MDDPALCTGYSTINQSQINERRSVDATDPCAAVYEFRNILEEMNVPASIRQTRGLEAAAACGQLRNSFQQNPMMGQQQEGDAAVAGAAV